MKSSGFASIVVLGALIAPIATVGCGGKTGNDNVSQPTLTGAGGSVAGVGGSTSIVDAGSFSDAGGCTLDGFYEAYCATDPCCGQCGAPVVEATLDANSCSIPLKETPPYENLVQVVLNCELYPPRAQFDIDAGGPPNGDTWVVDYFRMPTALLLGDSLCQRVKAMGDVSIFVLPGCPFICL